MIDAMNERTMIHAAIKLGICVGRGLLVTTSCSSAPRPRGPSSPSGQSELGRAEHELTPIASAPPSGYRGTWNDTETLFGKVRPLSRLLVPSYAHVLTVHDPGRRVALDGYHEHAFIGIEVRGAVGATRHVAQETIVFEKVGGIWRVTDYQEVNWNASAIPVMKVPLPGAP